MERYFLIEVHFYEGRYHGARGWPPAPARLFQALLAGSASGIALTEEVRRTLRWLESLPPPTIAAPRVVRGQGFTNFVPNNDIDSTLTKANSWDLGKAVAATRVGKSVEPLLFDARLPVLYVWPVGDDCGRAEMASKVCKSLYQLGRGHDMAWSEATLLEASEVTQRLHAHGGIVYRPTEGGGEPSALCPTTGSLSSLEHRYSKMRNRLSVGASKRTSSTVFAQPPKPRFVNVSYNAPPNRIVYELRSADSTFFRMPLVESSKLIETIRNRAATCLGDAVPQLRPSIERFLIGRGANERDKLRRVRLVPIPSVGAKHADMGIRRIAVYVPQACPITLGDLKWALSQVVWVDGDGLFLAGMQETTDHRMAIRFERAASRWQSITPLALTAARPRRAHPIRHGITPKGGSERRMKEQRVIRAVRNGLRHAGVAGTLKSVRVQREPYQQQGVRAGQFAEGTRFASDALWHVGLSFAKPIPGPLLLGDGRFLGLGLMQPEQETREVVAFSIVHGLAEGARWEIVARAARRAMMARVQARLRRGESLPEYVSGHDQHGRPLGGGKHSHIAVVADLPRSRLLFIAPSRLGRDGASWSEIRRDHWLTEAAIRHMSLLRAGSAGLLSLRPAEIDPDQDRLFSPSKVWESVTDYHVTRHQRRGSVEEDLLADVVSELERCGWPKPEFSSIEVTSVRRGPRGGESGRLRLRFDSVQEGPLIIGRTAHKGGGLFVGVDRTRNQHNRNVSTHQCE